jgi:hypothetical protein
MRLKVAGNKSGKGSRATTPERPLMSPGSGEMGRPIGASLRRGPYSLALDSPSPPCILDKQSQGRDRE